ncbi:MAG: IS1634 family transposase, partial [Sciscionella sp.]
MYVKTTSRKTKSGTVRYLHLAHNAWDAAAGRSVPKLLYGFGREDRLDREAIRRLVASLSTLLDPAEAFTASAQAGAELAFCQSRPFGGAFVLDQLWHRLNLPATVASLGTRGRGRPRDVAVTERVLFGLVANRALEASSKLAAADWITHDVHIHDLPEVDEDACYRAMDWLYAIGERLQGQVFSQVANLLNLEVDLLFFDTTSTYFQTGQADEPIARDEHGKPLREDPAEGGSGNDNDGAHGGEGAEQSDDANRVGFRTWGKSKDSRDDLPQIVIGMAVTRDGIPVRCWCWPGNTADQALIRQVKDEMRDWTLSKIVWVADRGFASAANRRYLRSGDHHYIIGEKLRSGSAEATAALSRQGRYQQVAGNMRVKEVRVSETDRFIICHNPDAATRDAAVREQLLAQLRELIEGSDTLSDYRCGELRGKIAAKPGLNRYLRATPAGKLRIDAAKIKTEANLDGKYLLRCSDPHLSA